MGAKYKIPFTVTTVAAQQTDLLRISAPATCALIIHEFVLDQATDTDSEQLEVLIHRGGSDGSGGAAATPVPLSLSYIAAATLGLVAVAGNTTVSSGGAVIDRRGFNVLTGLPATDVPAGVCEVSPSTRWVAQLVVGTADAVTFKGHVVVETIGG